MYKDCRYINAGENEFHRWGKKAVLKAERALKPNKEGFYSIPADGGAYWTFGTSKGKYGEFAKIGGTIFPVNGGGYIYAKAGTEKGEKFVEAVKDFIKSMKDYHEETIREREEAMTILYDE